MTTKKKRDRKEKRDEKITVIIYWLFIDYLLPSTEFRYIFFNLSAWTRLEMSHFWSLEKFIQDSILKLWWISYMLA